MDLTFLQPLYATEGPVASVHINVSRDAEDADGAIRIRWGKARDELSSMGADKATLRALDEVVGASRGTRGPRGQHVFASEGRVLLDRFVAEPPQEYEVRFGATADPMPYLQHRGDAVPYVLAVTDRVGADITAVHPDGRRTTEQVDSDGGPTHKPRGGAFHHNQIQRSVDEQVTQNLKSVAERVGALAEKSRAELVLIAGEVQARSELCSLLPDALRERATELEHGGRAAGSESSPLDAEVADHLERRARTRVDEVLEAFEQGRANRDLAAEGMAPVVGALRQSQVETLIWPTGTAEDADDLWIGPDGGQIAVSEKELREFGIEDPVRVGAGAALLRAAAATGASVVSVPRDGNGDGDHPIDTVSAVLRFPSAPTA